MAGPRHRWARRMGWLLLLWAAGVAAVFLLAQVLKGIMRFSGMG